MDSISYIYPLLSRSEREKELTRMSIGSLNTMAGSELSKALLDIDFNDL